MFVSMPTPAYATPEALQLIRTAVEGEKGDQLFYEALIQQAPTQQDRDIITSIRNDEMKHNQLFRQLYHQLTGQDIPPSKEEPVHTPASYREGLQQAFFGELKAVEKYRTIRQGLTSTYHRDILFEIITDEQKHADLYLYLLNKTDQAADKTPDDWIRYTDYLVQEGLEDMKRGINAVHILQEFILMGVLVGQGYTPEDAYKTVERWEQTGESQILQKSKQQP